MPLTANKGRYGSYGGCYLPELLMPALKDLHAAWNALRDDSRFCKALREELFLFAGRPTPLTPVPSFAKAVGVPEIYLKREDLLHTGAHKLNNSLGQCLLAKQMGKQRIIAETGAGQHGVATASTCARLGLDCVVYMGSADAKRQAPNVDRMQRLGAEVVTVDTGEQTLKDAINEALRDWASSFESSHYCIGSALGPHPYPEMVAAFQEVIGVEARQQFMEKAGGLPDLVVACVGGGSNAIGIFSAFLEDDVELFGIEAGGTGDRHAARCREGSAGVMHGCYTLLLQDGDGQTLPTHSISAGLDYPAIAPQHAALHESGRCSYGEVDDATALEAFQLLCRAEGVIPALESSHALGYFLQAEKPKAERVIINLSGRGDKDLPMLRGY